MGVVLFNQRGEILRRVGRYLGETTNNEAEYRALLLALEVASEEELGELDIRTDSELLCRQMNGVYKVKSRRLKPLHIRARQLAAGFSKVKIEWIPREENTEADRAANEAIDAEFFV